MSTSPQSETQHILVVVDDLFFTAKITETVRQLGAVPVVAGDIEEVRDRLSQNLPVAIIVDLGLMRSDPVALIDHFRHTPETVDIPMMAYCAHTNQALMDRAVNAGCEYVLPRSSFVHRLPDFIQTSMA